MTPSERMAAQRLFEQELAKEQALYNQRVSEYNQRASTAPNTNPPRRVNAPTMPSDGMATSKDFLGNWWNRTFGKKPAASAPSSGAASQGQGMSKPLQQLGTVADDAAKAASRGGVGKIAMASGGVPLASGLIDAGFGLASGEGIGKAAAGGVGNAIGTGVGMWGMAKTGAMLGKNFGPVGALAGSLAGGILGSMAGDATYDLLAGGNATTPIAAYSSDPNSREFGFLGNMLADKLQRQRSNQGNQVTSLAGRGERQKDVLSEIEGNRFNPLDNSPRSAQEDWYERQLRDAIEAQERQKIAQFERDNLLADLEYRNRGQELDSNEAIQLMSLYDQLQGRANNAVQTVISARYF